MSNSFILPHPPEDKKKKKKLKRSQVIKENHVKCWRTGYENTTTQARPKHKGKHGGGGWGEALLHRRPSPVGLECVCPQFYIPFVITRGSAMQSVMDPPVHISRSQELTRNANKWWYQPRGFPLVGSECVFPPCDSSFVITGESAMLFAMDRFPFVYQDLQSSQEAPTTAEGHPQNMYQTILFTVKCPMVSPQRYNCGRASRYTVHQYLRFPCRLGNACCEACPGSLIACWRWSFWRV